MHPENREEQKRHDDEPGNYKPAAEYGKENQEESHASLSVPHHFKPGDYTTHE